MLTHETTRSKSGVFDYTVSSSSILKSETGSPPSPGVAFSALLIAAGTVGLGGALGAIFAAGDVVNEDRKLRSIQ
jgi:hypothetical protein